MANEIRIKDITEGDFTITLASLADGSGRSSASVSNTSDYPAAIVSVKITSGTTTPSANSAYLVYLLRDVGTLATDNWGGSDAAITILNAPLLGTVKVTANASTAFYNTDMSTEDLGPLGPTWGIAIVNESGQALHSTGANHECHYMYYVPEVQ